MQRLGRILLYVLAATILLGVNGCMGNNAERIKDAALVYLNENYQDEFKPLGFAGKSWAYNYDTIAFESVKYKQQFRVYRFTDGKTTFTDTYFKLQMQEDAQQYLYDLFKDSLGQVAIKVVFGNFDRPKALAPNSTFMDYLNNGDINIDSYIFTEKELPANLQRQAVNKLAEQKITGGVTFVVANESINKMKDTQLDELLSSDNDLLVKRKDYLVDFSYLINEYDEVKYPQTKE